MLSFKPTFSLSSFTFNPGSDAFQRATLAILLPILTISKLNSEAVRGWGPDGGRGVSLPVDTGQSVWLWEVNEHELNLCSSILFRGGRKAKEKRKEMKTELCPPAKRNLIKRKYSI